MSRDDGKADRIERVGRRAPSLERIYERLHIDQRPAEKKIGSCASTLGDARSAAARLRQNELLHNRQRDSALLASLGEAARTGDVAALEEAAARLSRLAGRTISMEHLREVLAADQDDPDRDEKANEADHQFHQSLGLKLPVRC